MSMTSFWYVVIVKLEQISHLFLVFTVKFEQLDACWSWIINVHCSENCLKWTLKGQDRLSTLEGVHFGEGVQEMSLKWRETHKRSRAWKEKHSTYHEHDQPVDFEVIWIAN